MSKFKGKYKNIVDTKTNNRTFSQNLVIRLWRNDVLYNFSTVDVVYKDFNFAYFLGLCNRLEIHLIAKYETKSNLFDI